MNTIIQGDSLTILKTLESESVDCIITSPPYWGLRDYNQENQIGQERTLNGYLDNLLLITLELKRVLKKEGTLFWNHGDSFGTSSGSGERLGLQRTNRGTQTNKKWQEKGKPGVAGYEKSLLLQPFRVAMRMVDEQGWMLRNTLIWHKPNAMPSSAADRFTVDYEPVFFFVKSKKYYFEQQREPWVERKSDIERATNKHPGYHGKHEKGSSAQGIKGQPVGDPSLGRNKRSVWSISTHAFAGAHFATFPEALITPMILAGCPRGGVCLDPFFGAGTTGVVARKLGRNYIGIELNSAYIEIAEKRLAGTGIPLL